MLAPADQLAVIRRAIALLASSHSFDETMAHTIAAFLPALGDFGFFDLDVGGSVRRTARAFQDERVEAILRPTQWARQERTDVNLCALSTGQAVVHAVVDDAWYRTIAADEGHLRVLRELAFTSMISVPMRYQGELLGALTLFYGTSGRRYGEDELAFAIELASLAAPVVANVRMAEQQRQVIAALRASEERLRVGMDAGKLGVWDWDVASDRVEWSDRVYDLHGVTREQFGGHVADFAALIHPEDRAHVQAAIGAALAGTAEPYVVEFRVPFPDGSVHWLATRAEVYRDAQGAPTRMVGATFDVTERRELLEAAARARREAETANRAKDEFLAILGHELRNPLAPIVSALHVMDARDPSTFRRERDAIRRQVDHMVRLVDDLLDISRIAHGKIALVPERLDLVEVVEAAIDATRPGLVARGISIELDAPTRPLVVDADRVRLVQVIGNLLSNAAKFSAERERVTVSVAATSSEVEVAVIDRGAGIPAEVLPKVFELFVQGPQELARQRGGLGLGLAIVASVVALHGGRVAAHSDGLGTGATFRVTLPRAAAEATTKDAPAAPASTRRTTSVVIVDDNRDAAELLGDLLRLHGHDVRVAGHAHAALELLAERGAAVALLDLGLPEMDGFELAREIRRRSVEPIYLVAVTGYGLAADRERTRAAGFDDHLVKPVDTDLLLARLAAVVAANG